MTSLANAPRPLTYQYLAGSNHGGGVAGDEPGSLLKLPGGGCGLLVADAEADVEGGTRMCDEERGGEREAQA